MTDQPPVPDDSLSSLFAAAAGAYPRVWASAADLWAVTMLPADLIVIVVGKAMGLTTALDFAEAQRAGATGRVLLASVLKLLIIVPAFMLHFWSTLSLCDAALRGTERPVKDALAIVLSRLPAQLWTLAHMMARLLPLGFLAALAAGLIVVGRDSRVVTIGLGVLFAAVFLFYIVRWSMTPVVTLFEGISGGDAVRRSWAISGARPALFAWHFGVYYAVVLVCSSAGTWLTGKVFPEWSAALMGNAVNLLLTGPFSAAMIMGLYRRETARDAGPV
jgi:hypothetical protein